MSADKITTSIKIDFSDHVCRLADLQKEILEDVKILIENRKQVQEFIKTIDIKYRSVFEHRYLLGKTWQEVGDSVGYAPTYVQDICKKIIQEKISDKIRFFLI